MSRNVVLVVWTSFFTLNLKNDISINVEMCGDDNANETELRFLLATGFTS
jgi:hypothetical protein